MNTLHLCIFNLGCVFSTWAKRKSLWTVVCQATYIRFPETGKKERKSKKSFPSLSILLTFCWSGKNIALEVRICSERRTEGTKLFSSLSSLYRTLCFPLRSLLSLRQCADNLFQKFIKVEVLHGPSQSYHHQISWRDDKDTLALESVTEVCVCRHIREFIIVIQPPLSTISSVGMWCFTERIAYPFGW